MAARDAAGTTEDKRILSGFSVCAFRNKEGEKRNYVFLLVNNIVYIHKDKLAHIKLTKLLQIHCLEPCPYRYRNEKLLTRPQKLCLREHQLNKHKY